MSDENAVDVPLSDLILLRTALNAAYHHSTVLDLAEQYRKLAQRPGSSNLTKALGEAVTIADSYISLGEANATAIDE